MPIGNLEANEMGTILFVGGVVCLALAIVAIFALLRNSTKLICDGDRVTILDDKDGYKVAAYLESGRLEIAAEQRGKNLSKPGWIEIIPNDRYAEKQECVFEPMSGTSLTVARMTLKMRSSVLVFNDSGTEICKFNADPTK